MNRRGFFQRLAGLGILGAVKPSVKENVSRDIVVKGKGAAGKEITFTMNFVRDGKAIVHDENFQEIGGFEI